MKKSLLAAFLVISLSRATFADDQIYLPAHAEEALIEDALVLIDEGVPIVHAVRLVRTADKIHHQMMIAGLTSDEATELVPWFLPKCLPGDEEVVASEMGAGAGSVALVLVFAGISKAIADYGDTWGPADSGGKTESTDDEGSGDNDSDDGGSGSDDGGSDSDDSNSD